MMQALFRQQGAQLEVSILARDEVQHFIDTHAEALNGSFRHVEMSDAMRTRLERSNWVFSGMKTFHELGEAFPSLLDEQGRRKPFERFLNDVQSVDQTYNANYLRSEYNFIQASASMAARWEQFRQDGDRYYLQYRTAGDDRVRPEHAALQGVTLPIDDPFWEEYYPPNGWNCRCTVVQVRKSRQPATDSAEALRLGELATGADTRRMFHFNPGRQQQTVPDYNPYTISRCRTCSVPHDDKATLAAFIPDNQLCQACRYLRSCVGSREKSQRAIERKHYVEKEMKPLLSVKHQKNAGSNRTIKVGFTKYGNKHLFSDTFGRSSYLTKEELKNLGEVLKRGEYLGESALTHDRSDNIVSFYYFKSDINGNDVRLNVAKQIETRSDGREVVKHFLYSVNDIK